MVKHVFCLLFLLQLFVNGYGQKIDNLISYRNINTDNYFRFNYENDFFAASDKNYTQGYNFEVVSKKLNKNPIIKLFPRFKNSQIKYGLSLEHIGFTPKDYEKSEVQLNDRPFASAIFLKSFIISSNSILKRRVSQSFSLGVIGPLAFGKQMQVEIHRATGNIIPRGWDNQISNDLVLNYRIDFEQTMVELDNYFRLNLNASAQLGTLFSNGSMGVNFVVGIVNKPFQPQELKSKLKAYLFCNPIVSVVGYDATLQGGVFNNSSIYFLQQQQVENFTYQVSYGAILQYGKYYIEYSLATLSKEFSSGKQANWGGIKFGFRY